MRVIVIDPVAKQVKWSDDIPEGASTGSERLSMLQAIVGGYLERIPMRHEGWLGRSTMLLVDEEARLKSGVVGKWTIDDAIGMGVETGRTAGGGISGVLLGPGIIVGVSKENMATPALTPETVAEHVKFLS